MTWEELEKEVELLSQKINFTPDGIVSVVRGGIIPARLISRSLKVKNMYCLSVEKIGDERKVVTDILLNIEGKHILLIEDMLETGKSLLVAREYLEQKGALVKTASLYTMPISEVVPDYFLKEVSEVVNFPWE